MSRSALITGASRGIGRGIALGLVADGVDVIGLHYCSNSEAAQQTAKEIEAQGADVVLLRGDLGDDTVRTVQRLATEFLDEVEARTGQRELDILVSNASSPALSSLADLDEAGYRRVVDLNLTAPLFLLQALAPHFAMNGRVVNVSSGSTKVAMPEHLVYGATKSALNYLGLALAPVLAERFVTINTVLPGIIETDRTAGWLSDPAGREYAATMSVFKRVGTVEDVAALVRYLVSPAAAWTTGQLLDVSGGAKL